MEQLGDAANEVDSATTYYRQAQGVLIPPGMVWTDRESYERRKEAFDRIQQKLYGVAGLGRSRRTATPAPAEEPPSEAGPPAASSPAPEPRFDPSAPLSVWHFEPGLVVRIVQPFKDFDGQEILAGEVLHLIDKSYYFYDGGHTLRFAEKTIRLASLVDEHELIIANEDNAWFQPLAGPA